MLARGNVRLSGEKMLGLYIKYSSNYGHSFYMWLNIENIWCGNFWSFCNDELRCIRQKLALKKAFNSFQFPAINILSSLKGEILIGGSVGQNEFKPRLVKACDLRTGHQINFKTQITTSYWGKNHETSWNRSAFS